MTHYDQAHNRTRRVVLRWDPPEVFQVPVRTLDRLERRFAACPGRRRWSRARRFAVSLSLSLVAILSLAGCSAPAVRQQRLVARANMTFSDSAVLTYNTAKLLPQLLPGLASSGGAQNSGCTSCR
jgi:hypothetical protein